MNMETSDPGNGKNDTKKVTTNIETLRIHRVNRLDDLSDHLRLFKLASHLFGLVGCYLLSHASAPPTAARPRTGDASTWP